ncbi:hypothetical protein DL767_004466 [Monosporascus sp. MG133]|nr:hypothetical protein DL767_004466 [Monosporascus sp. MG133]
MDPLSITASAITLIGAASTLATPLYGFLKSHRNVDSRITGLCDELARLECFLGEVDRTLKGCQSPNLALVDDDLWRQSELALIDCQVTLTDLTALVEKIKAKAGKKGFGWRTRVVLDLSIHGSDLTTFRDKIYKSNWALQTMLQTITVSLSLRNSASQEKVLLELDRLKSSIDEALRAAVCPVGGFIHVPNDRSDARVARNLRNLAEAAKHFHSAASSTASTIHDDSVAPWHGRSGCAPSSVGDLPPFRRERVEEFVRGVSTHSPGEQTPLYSRSFGRRSRPHYDSQWSSSLVHALERARVSVPAATNTRQEEEEEEEEEDDGDEAEYERMVLGSLEELAKANIKIQDYPKAIEFLNEAMRRGVGSSPDNPDFRHFQIKLVLCYFLHRQWEQAEPIISSLAKTGPREDLTVSNLLHALSLAHLSKYSFDKALTACKDALRVKKRLLKKGVIEPSEYGITLGLMSTIFDMTGDYIRAEVFQRQLPEGFLYKHPSSEIDFVMGNTHLLQTVLGEYTPDFGTPTANKPECYEMDAGLTYPAPPSPQEEHVSPLKTKFDQHQRYEIDTAKEVVFSPAIYVDADYESTSTSSTNQASSLRRLLTSVFGTRKLRHNNAKPPPMDIPAPLSSLDSPAILDSRQSTVFPMKQWIRASSLRGLNKTKTLLRKKPHNGIAELDSTSLNRSSGFGTSSTDNGLVPDNPVMANWVTQMGSSTRGIGGCADQRMGPSQGVYTPPRLPRWNMKNDAGISTGGAQELDSRMVLELDAVGPCNGRWAGLTASPSRDDCHDSVQPTPTESYISIYSDDNRRIASPSEDLQRSLRHIASILASLPELRDAEKRGSAKQNLEVLSWILEPLSNNELLRADLRRAIEALGETENRIPDGATESHSCCVPVESDWPPEEGVDCVSSLEAIPPAKAPDDTTESDSGYGSMDSDRPYSSFVNGALPPHIPVLRRTFSWEDHPPELIRFRHLARPPTSSSIRARLGRSHSSSSQD